MIECGTIQTVVIQIHLNDVDDDDDDDDDDDLMNVL